VFNLCFDACNLQQPVNVAVLQAACTALAPGAVNEAVSPLGLTALDCVVLNEVEQPEAVQVLLRSGADPFGNPSREFSHSPIGRALLSERIKILKVLLAKLDSEASWKRLTKGIMAPPDIIEPGTWVSAHGRRAKTVDIGIFGGNGLRKSALLRFDDGSESTVDFGDLKARPAASALARSALITAADSSACCSGSLRKQLKDLEVGRYRLASPIIPSRSTEGLPVRSYPKQLASTRDADLHPGLVPAMKGA